MITHSGFDSGLWGNLGNQLFQYASLIGIADKRGTFHCLPRWQWSSYFAVPPEIKVINTFSVVKEKSFNYDSNIHNEGVNNIDFLGWFQSEKYWNHCKPMVKELLKFKDEKIHQSTYKHALCFDKKTIAISVRRGDYVDNPNYELLNADYYYLALLEHFPDWRDYNILIFSDDIPYCKVHFQCLPNVTFIEGLNPMEQLILGSMCDNFIIANSTFSWWMAYLGEREHSKIIRPNYLFAGELLANNDWSDFYPERWTKFDHKNAFLNLNDCTFIIPVTIDSEDRKENYLAIFDYIERYFSTKVQSGSPMINGKFHRTKWLNEATKESNTPIVINYDCDILTPPLQIYLAVEMLRKGEADFVYPYDGRFARVPRTWLSTIQKYNDVGMFKDTEFVGIRPFDGLSVGGVIAYRKDKFAECGGENERMVSYSPEDQERFYRFKKLGYKVERVKGCCYHIDHVITSNSSTTHPDYAKNETEFTKVKSMDYTALKDYVKTWGYFE